MHKDQRVAEMVNEVLACRAWAHVKHTGEAFEDALQCVLNTKAGRQLRELRDGPAGAERAFQWQEDLRRARRRERVQAVLEQCMLMEAQQRELEQPKEIQLV